MTEEAIRCPECGGPLTRTTREARGERLSCAACRLTAPPAFFGRLSRALRLLTQTEALEDLPGDLCVTYEEQGQMTIVDRVLSHGKRTGLWSCHTGPVYDPDYESELWEGQEFTNALIRFSEALAGGEGEGPKNDE